MPIHNHKIPASWDDAQGRGGEIPAVTRYLNNSDSAGTGGNRPHTHALTGASGEASSLPPYYALALIMRIA